MSQAGIANFADSGGGTVLETLTGNSGGAVSPSANNINTVGTGSITVVGNPATHTLTAQVTGLTTHNVLVGAGTATITKVAPSATSGVPLISQGASSDPTFGTAVVAGGGTGAVSFNVNGVVVSNTTTTGALASLTLSSGQLAIGSTGAVPVAAGLSAGANIAIATGAGSITISANTGSQTVNYTAVSSSPYVVAATDYYLGVDSSGGARTIQLPNAPATGRSFAVKDSTGSAATHNITVTTVGGAVNIDGATTFVMSGAYNAIQLIFNGTSYEVF